MVKNISEYGTKIKMRLVELGKSQNWLIGKVSEQTGLFFDSSYLYKIMCGKEKSRNVINAINSILDIEG